MHPTAVMLIQVVLVLICIEIGRKEFMRHWDDGGSFVRTMGFIIVLPITIFIVYVIALWGDDAIRFIAPSVSSFFKSFRNASP